MQVLPVAQIKFTQNSTGICFKDESLPDVNTLCETLAMMTKRDLKLKVADIPKIRVVKINGNYNRWVYILD